MYDDLDLDDIETLGIDDGTYDRQNHMSYQASYGSSIDLNELDEEQRDIYDLGYSVGSEDYDLYDNDDEDDDW